MDSFEIEFWNCEDMPIAQQHILPSMHNLGQHHEALNIKPARKIVSCSEAIIPYAHPR